MNDAVKSEKPAVPVVHLSRFEDRVVAVIDGATAIPVRVVWARPISGRGADIGLMNDKKVCVAMLADLQDFPADSRGIALEELDRRYCIARIASVFATQVQFGNRYWDVDTDRGRRRFLLREPSKNVTRSAPDQVMIRDTLGNRYVIDSFGKLDARSQEEAERAL